MTDSELVERKVLRGRYSWNTRTGPAPADVQLNTALAGDIVRLSPAEAARGEELGFLGRLDDEEEGYPFVEGPSLEETAKAAGHWPPFAGPPADPVQVLPDEAEVAKAAGQAPPIPDDQREHPASPVQVAPSERDAAIAKAAGLPLEPAKRPKRPSGASRRRKQLADAVDAADVDASEHDAEALASLGEADLIALLGQHSDDEELLDLVAELEAEREGGPRPAVEQVLEGIRANAPGE